MEARYALMKASDGTYFFRLKAPNHDILLTSEPLPSRSDARERIDGCRRNSCDETRYDRKQAADERFYFVLQDEQAQVIGKSELFPSRQVMERGIDWCKRNGPTARLIETM